MRRQLSRWGAAVVVVLTACALGPAGYSQSVAASPSASSATKAAAPKDGRIVAANLDTGQLETLNPDGSGRRTLTPAGENSFQPAWSPDGARVAFASDRAGAEPRIYTIKADGTGIQLLTDEPEGYVDNTPTYTPDGKRIIYTRCRPDPPGGCALYSVRTNGQDKHAVTPYDNGDRADFYPDVAPDGRIAFTRYADHGIIAQIWVVQADGSHPHSITTPQLEAGAPGWTHDGHHLLVTSDFSHLGENVYRVRDDGKQVIKLTSAPFPHNAQGAVMSPSGSKIVYDDDQAYPQVIGADLIVMNPNGSGKHSIATHTRLIDPDWGTAPLVKVSSAQSRSNAQKSNAQKSNASRPPLTLPRWLAIRNGQASPTTSRWSR